MIPELTELKKIIKLIKKKKPDLILAVGGGTVIDYAKSANWLEENISIKSFKSKKLNFKRKEVCNMTLDELLDKISQEGMESLSDLEKQKLEEYSKSL